MAIDQESGMKHVQNLLNHTFNFGIYHSVANSQTFNYLLSLSDFLKDQEQQFYDILGVGNIVGLNNLLKSISIDYKLSVLDAGGAVYKYIGNNYTFKDAKNTSSTSQTQYIEENIFDLFTQLLANTEADQFINEYLGKSNNPIDAVYDGLMDALTQTFAGIKTSDGYLEYVFTARGSRSSTGRYKKGPGKELVGNATIKINLNEAIRKGKVEVIDGKFVVTGDPLQFTSTVEKEIKERIRPELMRRLNKTHGFKAKLDNMSTNELRDLVNDIIINTFNVPLDVEDLEASQNIAISANSANISGYLGELQSRLYFKSLFANVKDAKFIDAGASYIKSLSGMRQMNPADAIIEVANHVFNIQVKNYAKGGASWGGSSSKTIQTLREEKEIRDYSSALSFIQERLQLKDKLFMQFFGAATWHNLNPRYSQNPNYEKYRMLYKEFSDIFNSLTETFDTFLPNIIRLTALINGTDIQYENFYFQKGVMIPASGIIDGIIDALYNAPSNKIFTSSYEMYPGESHYTPEKPWINDYSPFAKDTLISWHITINFNKVLKNLGL